MANGEKYLLPIEQRANSFNRQESNKKPKTKQNNHNNNKNPKNVEIALQLGITQRLEEFECMLEKV